ncbi:MAG TPA: tetraacyldisaccharide 4'-kinase [Pirellulales bacterium]
MPSPFDFRQLVSGRRRGIFPSALRGLLRLAEFPYTGAVEWRNKGFDSGRRASFDVGVPVVSVGNLTLGGTGKTPMVEWLARWFANRGLKIALVSRGYKSTGGGPNDEALELAQKLPGIVQLQNPDRVAAARQAIDQFGCQLILLDDAFQHRRIRRQLDIVLVDAMEPFGFDHVFPRGTLREPLKNIARAQLAVLTRADMVDQPQRARIQETVQRLAPHIAWAECRHAPSVLLSPTNAQQPLENLRGRRVAAFCGIGNPAGFRHTLAQCGYDVVAWREFPDHFAYDQTAIHSIVAWARQEKAEAIVCTHKDLVKIAGQALSDIPLWAVQIGMAFTSGQDQVEKCCEQVLSFGGKNT